MQWKQLGAFSQDFQSLPSIGNLPIQMILCIRVTEIFRLNEHVRLSADFLSHTHAQILFDICVSIYFDVKASA